jgi:uncharacterized protein
MDCPKCGGAMRTVIVEGTEIDRCSKCNGIWFDLNEQELLKGRADEIDIGTPNPKGSEEARIDCPRCKTRMINMVVQDQPHIKYEACTVCYGMFFDAGEFRDYAHKTFSDFLKHLAM